MSYQTSETITTHNTGHYYLFGVISPSSCDIFSILFLTEQEVAFSIINSKKRGSSGHQSPGGCWTGHQNSSTVVTKVHNTVVTKVQNTVVQWCRRLYRTDWYSGHEGSEHSGTLLFCFTKVQNVTQYSCKQLTITTALYTLTSASTTHSSRYFL